MVLCVIIVLIGNIFKEKDSNLVFLEDLSIDLLLLL
jgi:hypothetical protein